MNALLRGDYRQRVRLFAGLVLFTFVLSHYINHALGLIGLEAMESFQTLRFALTRSWPGTVALWGSALVHVGFALQRIAERSTWRMPGWEAAQIATGLLIPLLLVEHVVATRISASLNGADDYYRPILAYYATERTLAQATLLLLAWVHAMLGLHHWLRLAAWYRNAFPVLLAIAVLLPALALTGLLAASREMAETLASPERIAEALTAARLPVGDARVRFDWIARFALLAYGGLVAAAAGVIAARVMHRGRAPGVAVTYTAGPSVKGLLGATLLEISRSHSVPHASVCGGRARCSTCRVKIEAGAADLAPPRLAEAVTLGSIGAPVDVRLACQIRPVGPLTVTRLVSAAQAPSRAIGNADDEKGVERKLAIMFLDVRGFTSLSDQRLPYDVVFLLNRFFGTVGEVIGAEGGWIDKYMGDGLLAVFGREAGARAGARGSLRAAAGIDRALDRLNVELEAEIGARLAVGMGLHAGPVVVGRIGHHQTAAITVIGRTVNVAARLEALSKDKACQLVVSRELARIAGWSAAGVPHEVVSVRGAGAPVEILVVERARDLTGIGKD